ncbi:hypothetical protein [Lysobacter capsici]|uniref:hypothetical protein n=1 Tax=Lysobacter capsici TaxID=435897 RepID=UPI001C005BBA|nr:hypothetical protein [Lysobacter capsici]QWF18150.1 hypothetical protein KME82_05120 [Lysobacter capsici]
MDKFQNQLAQRAADRIGSADDFKIVVTQADFPIGTLLRQGSTIPVDYTSCLPTTATPKSSTTSLFPTYSMSRSLAIDFGLDSKAIAKLAELGLKLSDNDAINLSVANSGIQTLSDNDIQKITNNGSCNNALSAGSPVWLVRGYITGKRSFSLTSTNSSKLNAKVEKIGSFNVDAGSGSASLKLTDDSDVSFLQIISEIRKTPAQSSSSITSPTSSAAIGKVYIQKDASDTSRKAELVAKALSDASLAVAKSIEKIESKKMPKLAQVRYFNKSDRTEADNALTALKTHYPDAIITFISLPAPAGQLEIWLPRTGT